MDANNDFTCQTVDPGIPLGPVGVVATTAVRTVMKVIGKDVKRVQCLLCTQQLADGGGTSNLMNHLQVKHLEEYKRCTNDSNKSCKTQSTLHSFSQVCPPERATAITKCIAEFVTRDLRSISVVDGQGFTRLLG